ncbi:MAG: CvpA family protein [Alistipes sp.]|nr:CvpA family protein [Alistipes sp.]
MIDVVVIIALVWAFILGIKRGLVVQLCHLVGLYMAMLIAPRFASDVGSLFMDDPGKAYLAGFVIIVAAALILIWVIAPIIKAVVVWKPIKGIDTVMGGVLNIATSLIVIAALFSIFDRINLSPNIKQDKLFEMVQSHDEGDIKEKILALSQADIDGQMREYFEHKYISYETLDKSISFFPLAKFGTRAIPTIKHFDSKMREEAERTINQQIFFNN